MKSSTLQQQREKCRMRVNFGYRKRINW